MWTSFGLASLPYPSLKYLSGAPGISSFFMFLNLGFIFSLSDNVLPTNKTNKSKPNEQLSDRSGRLRAMKEISHSVKKNTRVYDKHLKPALSGNSDHWLIEHSMISILKYLYEELGFWRRGRWGGVKMVQKRRCARFWRVDHVHFLSIVNLLIVKWSVKQEHNLPL